MQVTIETDMGAAAIVDLLGIFEGRTMSATAILRREYEPEGGERSPVLSIEFRKVRQLDWPVRNQLREPQEIATQGAGMPNSVR